MSINPILNIETITKDDENLFSLSGVRAITLYGTFFYHRDHQGSIIALTDEHGDVVERIEYDEHYGRIIKHTKEREVETLNPYGYTGREIETEELYYYRARYYDAGTKRFLSVDPIGFVSGDFNFYRYVGNEPLIFNDPMGTTLFLIIPIIIGLAEYANSPEDEDAELYTGPTPAAAALLPVAASAVTVDGLVTGASFLSRNKLGMAIGGTINTGIDGVVQKNEIKEKYFSDKEMTLKDYVSKVDGKRSCVAFVVGSAAGSANSVKSAFVLNGAGSGTLELYKEDKKVTSGEQDNINFGNVTKSTMLGATLGAGGYKATSLLEGGFRKAFSYPNFGVIDNVLTHSTKHTQWKTAGGPVSNTVFESSGGVTAGVGANLNQYVSDGYDAVAEGNATFFTNGF